MPLYSSQPLETILPEVTTAIIAIHGLNGDAYNPFCEIFDSLSTYAENTENKYIIIAPLFSESEVNGLTWSGNQNDVNKTSVYWSSSSWMSGINDANNATSSYDCLDELLSHVMNTTSYPSMSKVVVTGFSAGGQTVNRYSWASSVSAVDQINLRFVSSDASSYLYLNSSRPDTAECTPLNDTGTSFDCATFVNTSAALDACDGYDEWKYGVSSFPSTKKYSYLAAVASDPAAVAAHNGLFARRDLHFLFGDSDVCNCNVDGFANDAPLCFPVTSSGKSVQCSPSVDNGGQNVGCCDSYPDGTSNDLATGCEAMVQGSNRLQRGLNYMNHLARAWPSLSLQGDGAPLPPPSYAIGEGLAHNSSRFYHSEQFQAWAFNTSV